MAFFIWTGKVRHLVTLKPLGFKKPDTFPVHITVKVLVHLHKALFQPVAEPCAGVHLKAVKADMAQRVGRQPVQILQELCNRLPRQIKHQVGRDPQVFLGQEEFQGGKA